MTELTLDPVLAARLPRLVGMAPLGAGMPTPDDIARFASYSAPVDGYSAPAVEVSSHTAPGPHGEVPVRVYRPPAGRESRFGLVWAHGGAFMFGDLDMPEADVVARELVARTGATVVSVDYHLCHGGVHFPIPHDDVHAAFGWAAGESGLLPDGAPWALGGASAGGNLAAGVAQRLRDEGGRAPSRLVLAYPVVHDPVPIGSAQLQAQLNLLPAVLRFPPESTAHLNRNYLGDNPSEVPYAFPALGRLDGLPPTLVIICEYDDLRPSGEAIAEALRSAEVPVTVELVEGVTHGHLNIPGLPAALHSLAGMAAFLAPPPAA